MAAAGPQLTYSFGIAAHTELRIVVSAKLGNVFYRTDLYDSPEEQLRFVAGPYSYVLYSLEGDPRKDAKASAGLVVTKDGKKVADMPCSGYAEFGVHFEYAALPQDTESYSAMAL